MEQTGQPIKTLYVHIPFCRKICPFCAFAVRKDNATLHSEYIALACEELKLRKQQFQERLGPLSVIYCGGGTPSSLTIFEVEALLQGIRNIVEVAQGAEISFEVNPEDASLSYFEGLASVGVNRISLGVQSFQKHMLHRLDRNHTLDHVLQALDGLKHSPIENFNLDLMFGVLGQTLSNFQTDVKQLLTHHPSHVSLYALDIEPNTPFFKEGPLIDWIDQHQELIESMYLWAVRHLKNEAILQYEVSNFARSGLESQSNLSVWQGNLYLGVGIGAHSYVDGARWANHRALRPYRLDVHKSKEPVAFYEQLTAVQKANEVLMLGLRQVSGFQVSQWQDAWQSHWQQQHQSTVEQLVQSKLARWNPPTLSLTPQGFLLADEITEKLLLIDPP